MEDLKRQVEKELEDIANENCLNGNIERVGMLVDIHKDLENEKYWKEKVETMRYRTGTEYGRENYGTYGRRSRDSRGRYMGGSEYGKRYRGDDMMNEMHDMYRTYEEGKEDMRMGNYGAKNDTIKSLEYMLESAVDFFEMLKKDANSQEEMEMIREYARRIAEM